MKTRKNTNIETITNGQTTLPTMNKERIRKTDIKRGQRTQKMMSFRCDNETIELLNDYPNKGRLINKLIKEYFKKNGED